LGAFFGAAGACCSGTTATLIGAFFASGACSSRP